MEVITTYKCEICNRIYDDKKWALDCEAQGYGKEYPIGCMYGDHTKGSFYENITFAVAVNEITKQGTYGHMNTGASWACRDNGSGDTLGEELCGNSSLELNEYYGKLDFEHPTFKRMVEYLKSQNIPITVWDGEKAVPYEEI